MGDQIHLLPLDLTLKRISMTALITHIYELPDIKEKMKEVIRTKYPGGHAYFPLKSIKKEIIKSASLKINTLDLPKGLISEVQGLLLFFAKKIASYAEFIIKILKLDMPYLDRIYWTVLGTIYDAKIFDEYWRQHKSFSAVLKGDDSNSAFLSEMACKYANEDVLFAQQNVMIKLIQKSLRRVRLPNIKNKAHQIIASYKCYIYGEGYDMTHRTEVHKKFQQTGNVSIRETILMSDGEAKCIKFLWNFLSDAEKDQLIIRITYDNLKKGLFCGHFDYKGDGPDSTELEMFGLAGYAEAVYFLLNEMTLEQRNQFLMLHSAKLMELFLRIWPYQEICLKMLNDETICEIIKQDCADVSLYHLLVRMVHDVADLVNVSGICQYPSVFYKILKKILSLVSKQTKKNAFLESFYNFENGVEDPDAIRTFFYIFDLKALSIIINDKDLKNERNLIMSLGSDKISKLISKGNIKSVLNFMEKVLVSNDERREFIKQWNLENNSLVANNPDFHEKIMGWLRVD